MQFPARFADLPEHAFPRLRTLLAGTRPGGPELAMTIGEPQHPVPFSARMRVAGSTVTPCRRAIHPAMASRSSGAPSLGG